MNNLYYKGMKNKLLVTVVTAFVLNVLPLSAQELPFILKQYNIYDGLLPGGRPLGMGYAFTAIGSDPSSIFFNPTGIQGVENNTLGITYEVAFQSSIDTKDIVKLDSLELRNLIFLGLVSNKGAFAWRPVANKSARNLNATGWEDNEIKINQFTLTATTKENNISTGLNISYFSGRIGTAKLENGVPSTNISDGNGVSADLGLLFDLSPQFRLGLNMRNLFAYMWWDDYGMQQMPFNLSSGFALNLSQFLVFAVDWEKKYYRESDAVEISHVGLEQSLGKVMKIQIGTYGESLSDDTKNHFTCGLTYQQSQYILSLAGEKYRLSDEDVLRYLFSLNLPL